jgi:acyl-CoA synthetase (AMP-forming)/AMP-acid ligase II
MCSLGCWRGGGTLVVPRTRGVDDVCAAIAEHRVEVLPASPTFLRMLLLADGHTRHDLSSLRTIAYGTEPMPLSTLEALSKALPQVTLKQTYGLTELGAMRTESRASGSLWMRVGGPDQETKVVNGLLYVRAASAMLGYLNAPSPFDAEGWYCTGDRVEEDADGFLRVLGRDSELINVGGEKVYPSEVENALLTMPNIADVLVYSKPNAVMGSVVAAAIVLREPEDARAFTKRTRTLCAQVMQAHKVPAFFEIVSALEISSRFKKKRPAGAATNR